MGRGASRVPIFGEPYTGGLGATVRCQQGDPLGSHQDGDGI
jgi:hypothetical protein